jgi:hypothetical protein
LNSSDSMSQQWFQTFCFASQTLSNSEHAVFGAFGFARFLLRLVNPHDEMDAQGG